VVSDTELVGRARLGDAHAFSELFRRHQPRLYRAALAIVRSTADAEDVTQRTWLQAYRTIQHFQGAASVTTWLGTIVRNAAIDHRRALRRRLERDTDQEPEAMLSQCVSALPSPEDLVLLNERRTYVARSMETLPPRLRTALRLWCSGMYTYDEMAQIARVATGTMKSRVWEARHEVTRVFQSDAFVTLGRFTRDRM
jgi:RNA polymerase sigma-70 factor (ECF subfamily)